MSFDQRMRLWLGQRNAGVVLAVAVGLIAFMLQREWPSFGMAVYLLAGLMLLSAIYSRFQDWRSPSAPGELHDVDGIKVHILAEGAIDRKHPIIWVAGGHGEGLIMHHLHKAVREETRSILFDRTGSGWTGPARAPVTFSGEVKQLRRLLEVSGENGPFVLAGHSFGGLFSTNFAHHYPELVAGVVLLDSTPPWNVAFAGKLSFAAVLRKAWWGALASQFGLHRFVEPEIDDPASNLAKELADVSAVVNWHSIQAKSLLAEASIFQASMDNPLDLVTGKGVLSDIPLLLMTTDFTDEYEAELRSHIAEEVGMSETQISNLIEGLRTSVSQQLELSSNSRHFVMPPDATHMFPYEYPEIVAEQVRTLLQKSD